MENILKSEGAERFISRIYRLTPKTQPIWGKMNVSQVLAHCNVTYQTVYDKNYPKPNFFMKLMLKTFVKGMVVGEKPFPKNGRTAPNFLITDERDFEKEKQLLVKNIKRTQKLGEAHFEGKQSISFGELSASEWNNLFAKHLDHHLKQFGV